MAQSYKSMKEEFVSNLSGGGIGEINTVTAVAPVSSIPSSSIHLAETDNVDPCRLLIYCGPLSRLANVSSSMRASRPF